MVSTSMFDRICLSLMPDPEDIEDYIKQQAEEDKQINPLVSASEKRKYAFEGGQFRAGKKLSKANNSQLLDQKNQFDNQEMKVARGTEQSLKTMIHGSSSKKKHQMRQQQKLQQPQPEDRKAQQYDAKNPYLSMEAITQLGGNSTRVRTQKFGGKSMRGRATEKDNDLDGSRMSVHSLASTINANNIWKYKEEQTPMGPADMSMRRRDQHLERIDDANEEDDDKFSGQGKPTPGQGGGINYGTVRREDGSPDDAWRNEGSVHVQVDQLEAILGQENEGMTRGGPSIGKAIKKMRMNSKLINKRNEAFSLEKNPNMYNSKFYLNSQAWTALAESKSRLSHKKLKQIRFTMTRVGIPDSVRGNIWIKLFDIEEARSKYKKFFYQQLCEVPNDAACLMIMKDVDRTKADLGLWEEEQLCGNNKLFNVLKAYANIDKSIGYVQGLNYIVAIMLVYIEDEEDVFWCLYQLMIKYNWRQLYTSGFPKLFRLTTALDERLRSDFPKLLEHLEENSLLVHGTFVSHFMTFLIEYCPIEITTRLFEIFILDGEEGYLKVMLRMIQHQQDEIFSKTDVALQTYMKQDIFIECISSYPMSHFSD